MGSCNGGLMATALTGEVRGRAGGWYNAGNLGGSALGAGVMMTLLRYSTPRVVGMSAIAMMVRGDQDERRGYVLRISAVVCFGLAVLLNVLR